MITLTPAYGRDYKSINAVKEALSSGADFIINDMFSPYDGKPCSSRDFPGQKVKVRYSGLRKVAVIQLP